MKSLKILLFVLICLPLINSCDLIDPTVTEPNPNLTSDAIIALGATDGWVEGLSRQYAIVTNNYLVQMELAGDNYVNTSTFFNQNFDDLLFSFQDDDVDDFLFVLSDLRESVYVGLGQVVPGDDSSTDGQRAEMYFYKGLSFMLLGEYFTRPVIQAGGVPVDFTVALDSAIENFEIAISLGSANTPEQVASYNMGLARANYYRGNQAAAVAASNAAIAADADHVRLQPYDNLNTPTSTIANAIYDRTNFDLQPLPRLDFLDPKFSTIGTVEEPFPITKIEEAHLILAEAAIADGDLPGARTILINDLLPIVSGRDDKTFTTTEQRRENGGTGPRRPSGAAVTVRASATDDFRTGLVIARADSAQVGEAAAVDVTVSLVSGTSVDAAFINAATTEDELLEVLYLMRQEIFIAEGRRAADLGIKLPLSQTEQLQNPNVELGSAALEATVPSFLPTTMDAFTWNRATDEVTITSNLNAILVANKADAAVLPFH